MVVTSVASGAYGAHSDCRSSLSPEDEGACNPVNGKIQTWRRDL